MHGVEAEFGTIPCEDGTRLAHRCSYFCPKTHLAAVLDQGRLLSPDPDESRDSWEQKSRSMTPVRMASDVGFTLFISADPDPQTDSISLHWALAPQCEAPRTAWWIDVTRDGK